MAKFDLVIPCYNYARYLEACVRSVTSQSITDLRILIIDDASTDDSAAVAQALAQGDPRITVVSHAENWGHIRTYNQGIDWAEADYFVLLSADDLLAPGALGRVAAIMDQNPDIVLTHGKGLDWRDDEPFPSIEESAAFTWRRQDLVREVCSRGANLVCTPTAVVRTHVQKAVGGYRPALPHSGDMEMWLRIAARGTVASIDASVQAIYRKHRANMSHAYFDGKLGDFVERRRALDSFFAAAGPRLRNAAALRNQAYSMLAAEIYWSGLAQFFRGYSSNAADLLALCFELKPRLRYLPPIRRFFSIPHVGETLRTIAADAAANVMGLRLSRK